MEATFAYNELKHLPAKEQNDAKNNESKNCDDLDACEPELALSVNRDDEDIQRHNENEQNCYPNSDRDFTCNQYRMTMLGASIDL